jgi:ethanolamine utilization cobalamin adenosyltransferase
MWYEKACEERTNQPSEMLSYVSPEMRVRKNHPLRAIRAKVDEVLMRLSPRLDGMYREQFLSPAINW